MLNINVRKSFSKQIAINNLLMSDFVPSMINDMDREEWIVSLTVIIKVACVWEQVACK